MKICKKSPGFSSEAKETLSAKRITAASSDTAPTVANASREIIDRKTRAATEISATAFPQIPNSSALATRPSAPAITAKILEKRH
jgi:hypothetical protein